MFEYDMLEYPPSKLDCRKSLSLLKCSFYKPIWRRNLLILFYFVCETYIWHSISFPKIFQWQFQFLYKKLKFLIFTANCLTKFEIDPSLSKSTSLKIFLISFSAIGWPFTGLNLVHPASLTASIISLQHKDYLIHSLL